MITVSFLLPSLSLPPGPVKKCGLLKILHEKHKPVTSKQRLSSETLAFKRSLQEAADSNRDLQPHIHKAQVSISLSLVRMYSEEHRVCMVHQICNTEYYIVTCTAARIEYCRTERVQGHKDFNYFLFHAKLKIFHDDYDYYSMVKIWYCIEHAHLWKLMCR